LTICGLFAFYGTLIHSIILIKSVSDSVSHSPHLP